MSWVEEECNDEQDRWDKLMHVRLFRLRVSQGLKGPVRGESKRRTSAGSWAQERGLVSDLASDVFYLQMDSRRSSNLAMHRHGGEAKLRYTDYDHEARWSES